MNSYFQTVLVLVIVTLTQLQFGSTSESPCQKGTRERFGRVQKPNYIPMQEGACQQYGHSCLGGHGKRNGVGVEETEGDAMTPDFTLPEPSNQQRVLDVEKQPFTSWYLSLLRPRPSASGSNSPYYNAGMMNKLLQFVATANDDES